MTVHQQKNNGPTTRTLDLAVNFTNPRGGIQAEIVSDLGGGEQPLSRFDSVIRSMKKFSVSSSSVKEVLCGKYVGW